VSNLLDIDQITSKAHTAASDFYKLDQEQTDRIVTAAYEAGFDNRVRLARMAVEETGIGVVSDKIIKNVIATRYVYRDIKHMQTVGIINEDETNGILEIARPIGPIFAVTPITNPTSTVLFKILIALKTRNPLIIYPHGGAKTCSIEAAKICYEAVLKAGAPENCIQWIKRASREEVIELMGHKHIALVLATGSVSLVRQAYSSGNPAIGIGPGNVPVYIGKTADVPFTVDQILLSKTFDNGTICASEQAVIVSRNNSKEVIEEFKRRKAYFLNEEEISKLESVAFSVANKVMNTEVIGKPASVIAKMAGFEVPEDTTVLIACLEGKVGLGSPLSLEILAPILAFYEVENFQAGIEMCRKINSHGGLGHTVSIFSNDPDKIRYFARELNAGRVLVNTPASQGALGGGYNRLSPSMTLACGAGGKNITTDNITARHLLNIQRIAFRREDRCAICDQDLYFNENLDTNEVNRLCQERYENW
jgi:acetaldehyde dehydrogenase/alcohol dehydrogenase